MFAAALLGRRDEQSDDCQFRIGQIAQIAQLAAVAASEVLYRPYLTLLRSCESGQRNKLTRESTNQGFHG